jgi:hypothetical protein
MVGAPGKPSPTVYMVGSTVAVVADQLLTACGTVNLGNVSPATQVAPSVLRMMGHTCSALGRHLGLQGQWGVDFVLDDYDQPVMVDLNMGRPNGSLSYYCWRARQLPPSHLDEHMHAAEPPMLAMAASTFVSPEHLRLAPFAASLRTAGLLWDSARGDGIILAQHMPGFPDGGTVLAASWMGTDAALLILGKFRDYLDSFSMYAGTAGSAAPPDDARVAADR